MRVIATQVCFIGLQRRRVGDIFDWPLEQMPVISPRYVKPVDPADQDLFDWYCLPVNARPRLVPKESLKIPEDDNPGENGRDNV